MKNLALGRYVPFNTFIHRLDPRTKIITMIALLVCVFLPIGFVGYIGISLFLMLVLKVCKIKIKTLFNLVKNMWVMFLFLFVINLFTFKSGNVILNLWGLEIYDASLIQTLYIIVRLIIMITITTILTSSTKPLDLTYALEYLFTPLKVVKFPAHQISMIISIALRFIPTLLEETERIMKAQASRGSIITEGKFKEKIPAIISLVIPLFFSAFQRSEELANAMEARGYDPTAKRTRYRLLKLAFIDVIAFFIVSIVFSVLLFIALNHNLIETWAGFALWW